MKYTSRPKNAAVKYTDIADIGRGDIDPPLNHIYLNKWTPHTTTYNCTAP